MNCCLVFRKYALGTTYALFYLVLLSGCDEPSQSDQDDYMVGSLAGTIVLGGTSAGTMSGVEVPLANIEAGGTTTGGTTAGGTTAGESMAGESNIAGIEECSGCNTDCQPIQCECADAQVETFPGCQDNCCLTQEEANCAQLCATLNPCEYPDTRCIEGSPDLIEQCSQDGMWLQQNCNESEACELGACLPTECEEGSSRCLDNSQTLRCENGNWVLGPICSDVCLEGECTSSACSFAAGSRSYLGCEYLAVELPNVISSPISDMNGLHPPVGVVISNTSDTQSTIITFHNPQGEISDVIQEELVMVTPISGLSLTPQTIYSEIRDANGQRVGMPLARIDQIEIPPSGMGIFLLPTFTWGTGSNVERNAYRISTNYPVSAYQFAPYCCNYSFSNDASLLIPTTALGNVYKYLGIPTLVFVNEITLEEEASANTLTVVAHEDQTQVRFTFPQADLWQAVNNRPLVADGNSYVIELNRQETLMLRSSSRPAGIFGTAIQPDLTGTMIESSNPVAVFSGHECMNYPSTLGACDHLEEQIFPIDTWGQNFSLVPVKERGVNSIFERTYWKILAEGSNARVQLSDTFSNLGASGPGVPGVPDCGQMLEADGRTINLGTQGFCEFGTKKAVDLSSDQRLMVMGIISGQASVNAFSGFGDHLGDPAIFLVPPSRQFRDNYRFLTPDTYYSDFVTLTFVPGVEIVLDGLPVDLSTAQSITGSNNQYMYVELSDGAHHITANQPFGITVFAFDDFVSYAFTGGLNLTKR
jgi:hypothetical protein